MVLISRDYEWRNYGNCLYIGNGCIMKLNVARSHLYFLYSFVLDHTGENSDVGILKVIKNDGFKYYNLSKNKSRS